MDDKVDKQNIPWEVWMAIPEFNSPAHLFHQGYQPFQMVPFFQPTQEFPLIHLHQKSRGDLVSLENLSVQQTPSHLLRNKNFYYYPCFSAYKEMEDQRG